MSTAAPSVRRSAAQRGGAKVSGSVATNQLYLATKPLSEALRHLVSNRCEQVFASPFTTAADLGANSAVLVVGRVLLALLGACPTGCRAGLGFRAEDAEVRLGLPDEDASGGLAGVGAVEAESNAANHLRHVWLCEVGVGAARARRRAVDAVFDAAHQQVTIENGGARVCLEHVANSHVLSLFFEWSDLFYTSPQQPRGFTSVHDADNGRMYGEP